MSYNSLINDSTQFLSLDDNAASATLVAEVGSAGTFIGTSAGASNQFFDGDLAGIKVFDVAKNYLDIAALYAEGVTAYIETRTNKRGYSKTVLTSLGSTSQTRTLQPVTYLPTSRFKRRKPRK